MAFIGLLLFDIVLDCRKIQHVRAIYGLDFPSHSTYHRSMSMPSGVRFRCYPSKDQSAILSQWIGHQRFIYNSKVEEGKYFRTFRNHSLSLAGQFSPADQQYCQFKDKELPPFLYEVPSQILRNGAYRFMQANSRFRQGLTDRPARERSMADRR